MGQVTQGPTYDPVDSPFAELMSCEFALDSNQEHGKGVPDTIAPFYLDDLTHGAVESPAEVTLEPFFLGIGESFDLFALELDLCLRPSIPEVPVLCDLTSQAASAPPSRTPADELAKDAGDLQPQPKKRKRSSMTSSQRQREEITRLRTTVTELEQQLESIKALNRRQFSLRSVQSPSTTDNALRSLWECVARYYDAERLQAEQINTALHQEIKTNLTLATSLEQSLRSKRKAYSDLT